MIRWRYVAPRIVVLGGLLLAVLAVKDAVIAWSLSVATEQVARAPVSIERVRSQLATGIVRLEDVTVADARRPGRNLLSYRTAAVDLDMWALTQGRLVVEDATVLGIEFGTPRDEEDVAIPRLLSLPDVDVPDLVLERMRIAAGVAASADVVKPIKQAAVGLVRETIEEEIRRMPLASVERATAIRDAWKRREIELESQLDLAQERLRQLWEQVSQARGSLAEKLPLFEQAAREFEHLRQFSLEAQRHIDSLPEVARRDLLAIEQAIEADIDAVRARINTPLIDADRVTRALIGETFQQHLVDVTQAVKTVQSLWPTRGLLPSLPPRPRGRVVEFPPDVAQPRLLIHRANLSGQFAWRGVPTEFTATVYHLTDRPKQAAEPVRVEAQFQADAEYRFAATFDTRGKQPSTHLVASARGLHLPAQLWGDIDDLALEVASVPLRVEADVTLGPRNLTGTITWYSSPSETSDGRWATVRSNNPRLGELLARLDDRRLLPPELRVTIHVWGTPEQPTWELESNLGEQLARNLNRVLVEEANELRDEMTARLRAGVTRHLAGLEDRLLENHDSVRQRLDVHLDQIHQHQTFLRSQLVRVTQARLLGLDPERAEQLNERIGELLPDRVAPAQRPLPPEMQAETLLDRLLR